MPSSEYYRRQAETLLALALNTTNRELSTFCESLATEYGLLAEKAAAGGTLPRPRGEAEAGEY